MKPSTIYFALMAAMAIGSEGANCGSSPGVANGECVTYYKNSGGSACGLKLGSYKPTCAGNCFQYDSFDSIKVAGDGTYGTNCYFYSDNNCQNYVGQTGNTVSIGGCKTYTNSKSMKCYYRC